MRVFESRMNENDTAPVLTHRLPRESHFTPDRYGTVLPHQIHTTGLK